ncbi:hypothetical protein ABBQ32_013672 [Trebouxia sp. C0010 RCD-2024]
MRRVSVLVLTLAIVGIAVALNPLPLDNSLHHYATSWLHDRWSICLRRTGQNTSDCSCKDNNNSTTAFDAAQLPINASQVPSEQQEKAAGMCQLSGTVQDCCCDYASVERANKQQFNPLLSQIVKTPFFRYFKVNLWCDCSFWPDDSMCVLQDCSVCECEDDEVPQVWKTEEHKCTESALDVESAVRRTVGANMQAQLLNIPSWRGFNNPWMAEDDQDVDFSYINLVDNPERYTGYKGEHAHRVWSAIYDQSCFSNLNDTETCQEQRVFYRLISGMHASISAHLSNEYLMNEETDSWGQNLEEFTRRLGNTAVKERVENMYFTYLFVLRAVLKAGPLLESVDYSTGCQDQDVHTKSLMQHLVSNEALKKTCPIPFDEGRLWKGTNAAELKQDLQKHFQNITRVMDCVGCEKCKLWGKLQILGIATSLKILFSQEDCSNSVSAVPQLHLERNEVIALVNLLERLSKSIEIVRTMSLHLGDSSQHPQGLGAIQDLVLHKLQDVL